MSRERGAAGCVGGGGVDFSGWCLSVDDVSMAGRVAMATESAGIRADDPWRVCHAWDFPTAASRNPAENRSLIAFTAWSSLVHAAIMAIQAFQNASERGHLLGDVPALVIVGIALIALAPAKQSA